MVATRWTADRRASSWESALSWRGGELRDKGFAAETTSYDLHTLKLSRGTRIRYARLAQPAAPVATPTVSTPLIALGSNRRRTLAVGPRAAQEECAGSSRAA